MVPVLDYMSLALLVAFVVLSSSLELVASVVVRSIVVASALIAHSTSVGICSGSINSLGVCCRIAVIHRSVGRVLALLDIAVVVPQLVGT